MCMLSCFSHIRLSVAYQAPLSLGFFRQVVSSSGDPPNPGIELASLKSPALAGGFFTASAT